MHFLAKAAVVGIVCTTTTKIMAAPLPLVTDGKPQAVILIPAAPDPKEDLAAKEIQDHVAKISGAKLEIRRVPLDEAKTAEATVIEAHQTPITLGKLAATPALFDTIRKRGTDPASFALEAGAGGVHIAGLSPEGTLDGSYDFLEQLGVRWFMPGELGTVIPAAKTLSLPEQKTVQSPSFAGRWHGASVPFPDWSRRLRMGGPYFPPAHGMPGTPQTLFATHPELFALIGGERRKSQVDVSNPEVLRRVVEATRDYFRKNPDKPWIGMGPFDGGGFCECPRCQALDGGDWDPFANERSVTDRYIWFFNQVLDAINDEFPDKKICFYSYHTYMRPPVKVTPNPRIVPAFAPITLCRIHGIDNPVCPERSYYRGLMTAWGKILPEIYERGYWFNLSDPGMPFSEIHKIRTEVPVSHAAGIKGWRVETVNHWACETPTLYVAAKLMWNHEADVDVLLADFYDKFFGPAREPMAKYGALMDAALRDGDFHTGSSFDIPNFYPPALRDQARAYLNRAAQLAPAGPYAERVKVFRAGFDYMEAFVNMLAHRNQLDFVAANGDLQRVDALQTQLLSYDPPMLNPAASKNYLRRFFRQPVEQGFKRVTDGNELVAGLADEWQFTLDPQRLGEDLGYWKADIRGGNWRPLKTSSLSWSDQGLRYYKGEAWYRQEVDIPARFAGKRVFLWFGGVDEEAKVWINGTFVGISHKSAFLPFELDATTAVKPGKNVVAVRLINQEVNELGTGGITAPVMFYAPAAGQDAQLENVKDLSPTFP